MQLSSHLTQINESLRGEYANLKTTKDDLIQHISNLIQRSKQLANLKHQLMDELLKAQERARVVKQIKEPQCAALRDDLRDMDQLIAAQNAKLKNMEIQYEHCLGDYDQALLNISQLVQQASNSEQELIRMQEADATAKAMAFDCERLKRVLTEERRYFKELTHAQEKTHEERLKQLNSIRQKLVEEQALSSEGQRIVKRKLGLLRIGLFVSTKMRSYCECLFREQFQVDYRVKIGIKTLGNALSICAHKVSFSLRKYLTRWHNNSFNKESLTRIVQRAAKANMDSRGRLIILDKMAERIGEEQSMLLQTYQKIKFLMVCMTSVARKDKHFGFMRWRSNCSVMTNTRSVLNILMKTVPRVSTRGAFRQWRAAKDLIKRYETAAILLQQVEKSKQMGQAFRKWRRQVRQIELGLVDSYLRRMKERQLITTRLNYEKRKVRLLTILQLKLGRVRLRNYFYKYWEHAKQIGRKQEITRVQAGKQSFALLRKQSITASDNFALKDLQLGLGLCRKYYCRSQVTQCFKEWRGQAREWAERKRRILRLVLRRECRNKIYVMNDFRKCVQYYEKKQLHNVLTDLNRKMQGINEKSSTFREQLKNCIQNLGVVASHNMGRIVHKAEDYQQRLIFDAHRLRKVSRGYRERIMNRFFTNLTLYSLNQNFSAVRRHSNQIQCQKRQEKLEARCMDIRKKRVTRLIWNRWSRRAYGVKNGLAKCIHAENVMLFYLAANGFAALQRKSAGESLRVAGKQLQQLQSVNTKKQENYVSLSATRTTLKTQLHTIFQSFVKFQYRNERIKKGRTQGITLKRMFSKYRMNAKKKARLEQLWTSVERGMQERSMISFWKSLILNRYGRILQDLREDLSKINKKRKTVEEKNLKGRVDIRKKLEEERAVHRSHLQNYTYYLNRYEGVIKFADQHRKNTEAKKWRKAIFEAWRQEWKAVKAFQIGINRVINRHYVATPCHLLIKEMKKYENQTKSQMMLVDLFQKKGELQLRDGLLLWRYNIKKLKCTLIRKQIDGIAEYETQLKNDFQECAELISREVIRSNEQRLLGKVFMGFKKQWLMLREQKRKLIPFKAKWRLQAMKEALKEWKWDTYVQKIGRAYVQYKKATYEKSLVGDVFKSLKMYREDHYHFIKSLSNFNERRVFKATHHAMNKIINVAAHERDELNYERKRALCRLLAEKELRIKCIKLKIMKKWHAWLIPRTHYLPVALQQYCLDFLKKAFARINEHKYWNEHYVKTMADVVTNQGYGKVNALTNSLIRQGCDPDEIKQFLTKKNGNDNNIIAKVVNHMRVWGTKEQQVRAFHSWKQYLQLKKNIKRALTRALNVAGGMGRYWGRWRSKDEKFNSILKRESRTNMLAKYQELSRLLKEYRRDVNDSVTNLQQIKIINAEYKQGQKIGWMMAVNALSNSIAKGLRQGFYLWRDKLAVFQQQQMDAKYNQIIGGIEGLTMQKQQLRYRLAVMEKENTLMREKCAYGVECGRVLQKILSEKDVLSIDLADREHNLKLLLEDNLRFKQKIQNAKEHADRLIRKVAAESLP